MWPAWSTDRQFWSRNEFTCHEATSREEESGVSCLRPEIRISIIGFRLAHVDHIKDRYPDLNQLTVRPHHEPVPRNFSLGARRISFEPYFFCRHRISFTILSMSFSNRDACSLRAFLTSSTIGSGITPMSTSRQLFRCANYGAHVPALFNNRTDR